MIKNNVLQNVGLFTQIVKRIKSEGVIANKAMIKRTSGKAGNGPVKNHSSCTSGNRRASSWGV